MKEREFEGGAADSPEDESLRYRLRPRAARATQGPFWRHHFWDRFLRNAKECRERVDSMHLNPVRKGLVKRP
jgi:hypothetical protein